MNFRANRHLLGALVGLALPFVGSPSLAQPPKQGADATKGRPKGTDRLPDEIGKRFLVYDDQVNHFIPGGYMPDGRGISLDLKCRQSPYADNNCLRLRYRQEDNPWVGVAFLLDNQWEPKRQFNLYKALGAKEGDSIVLRFHARSSDRATVKFKVAGLKKDAQALPVEIPWLTLKERWQQVEISLSDADLSSLHGALIVVLDREHNADLDKPVIQLDLDQIYFTKIKAPPK